MPRPRPWWTRSGETWAWNRKGGRGLGRRAKQSEKVMPNSHAKAAKSYRPAQTSLLFVAEAPPNSIDRYFYYEAVEQGDWLWIALMKALYAKKWGQAETQRLQKRKWLKEFKDDQYRLIDAV